MGINRPQLFQGIFAGKKVLVIGHTGFKGAWLTLWLRELGVQVAGYALEPPTQPNLFDQCELGTKIRSHRGDVRDAGQLKEVFTSFEPQIVFHLAAQPLVRLSYKEPLETFATNLMGTVHVLEAVRQTPSVRVCQVITSDKCYRNQESSHPYVEEDPLGGADPYSASKACAEIAAASYRHSFFSPKTMDRHRVSISSVRAGNVIGGGDWAENRILPDSIRALLKNESIPVRNPGMVRPWQHVLDALSGYLVLAASQMSGNPLYADAWNFGPPLDREPLTVAELVERVIKDWGSGSWSGPSEETRKQELYEMVFLRLDSSKSNRLLGWRPMFTVEEAISQTVKWYRNVCLNRSEDPLSATSNQIHDYERLAAERGHAWAQSTEKVR